MWLGPALSGRTVTLWADRHSIHVSLDGAWTKTVPTRLSVEQLSTLAGRGSRPAGPAPAPPALPTGRRRLSAATVVDVDRTVDRNGIVHVGGQTVNVGADLAGQRVTLRLDGHLMRVIAGGRLARTMPAPIPPDEPDSLTGARRAADPTPPPTTAMRVQRNVPADGVVMVARQRLRVGRAHAGKTVTVVIEDTYLRVLHHDIELSLHPRTGVGTVNRFKAQDRTKK